MYNFQLMADTYVRPTDVHAPKRHWSLVHVIFDGGADTGNNTSPNSLAIGRWDNNPVLAMRWNGNKSNPLGNPQSRGLPTWFVVPDQYWKQILETGQYNFSDDMLTFVRNFLEFRRVYFMSHCPNPGCRNYGGLVLHSFVPDKIEATLGELEADTFKLYHIICDGFWIPGGDEKKQLIDLLKAAREKFRRRFPRK